MRIRELQNILTSVSPEKRPLEDLGHCITEEWISRKCLDRNLPAHDTKTKRDAVAAELHRPAAESVYARGPVGEL